MNLNQFSWAIWLTEGDSIAMHDCTALFSSLTVVTFNPYIWIQFHLVVGVKVISQDDTVTVYFS